MCHSNQIKHNDNVVGVMKMGNMTPKAGIERTSLAFRASILTITPPSLPYVNTLPTPTCLRGPLPETITLVSVEL